MATGDYRVIIPLTIRQLRGATLRSARGAAKTLARKLVDRSPVDDGTTRGNWHAGVGQSGASADMASNDPSGQVSKTRMFSAIQAWGGVGHMAFGNALPYVPRLEFDGWSDQAPSGWIRLSMEEVPDDWVRHFGIEFYREAEGGEENLGISRFG
jgi:hypothetical protein